MCLSIEMRGCMSLTPMPVSTSCNMRVITHDLAKVSHSAARVVKDRSILPVVAITGADPVATGLIDNLARPGGTITGVGEVAAELSAKRLEVLKDAFPSLGKIAMLRNADDLGMTLRYRSA